MADDATKKQTCLQCRKRKVRCDGELSGCSNCSRLNFTCYFLKAPGDSTGVNLRQDQETAANSRQRTKYTIGGIERRRGLRACRPCRASKSRCSGEWPACRNCEMRGLDCQYMPSKRRKILMDPAPCPGPTNNTPNEPTLSNLHPLQGSESFQGAVDIAQSNSIKDIGAASNKIFLESHVNTYFEYFHVIPQFNFLHKSSFLRNFHHDTLDQLILRCVCGIASRFINQNSNKSYVSRWMEEVEAQIWSRTGEMNIQNLQLIVLLVCWYSLERRVSHMWTTSAMATRMAYGLRLNHETTDRLPFVLRESRRRLMWLIFMFDKMYAGGISELTLCTASTMHISLPCEGRNFDLDIPIETSVLEPANPSAELEAGIGIMGHITRLMNIRHAILELTKKIISSKTNPYISRDSIQNLDNMLNNFALNLPNHLQDNSRNLLCRAYTSDLAGYVSLHSLLRQCYCDLYRMMIPGIRESVPGPVQQEVPLAYAEQCRRLCLHHAVEMCRLWSDTLREGDLFRLTDQSIGIYAYQCANIIANLWELDHYDTLKVSLQTIASILERLATIYPIVAEIQSEIKGLINSLDIVTGFYNMHRQEMLSQTLTCAWRSSLRQRGVQDGQTTSKFSLLEFLQNQNGIDDSNTTEEYSTVTKVSADSVAPAEVNTVVTVDMGMSFTDRSDLPDDDLWSPGMLGIGFDMEETQVDPFSRIFEDWSLMPDSQN